MSRHLAPLDPDSDKGRETAARLSVVFADVRAAIAGRRAVAASETPAPAVPAAAPEPVPPAASNPRVRAAGGPVSQ